jgi:DnaJ-class molecular chaperone
MDDEFGRVTTHSDSFSSDISTASDGPSAVEATSGLDVKVIVTCTLEEMYNCASKIISVSRRRENGQYETKPVKVTLTLGLEDHTTIVVARQGHREEGKTPGDLVFLISQVSHRHFTRDGDDIIQKVTISLKDAISGLFVLRATAVDREDVSVGLSEIVQPGQAVKVAGRGMRRKDGSRGDHVFRINVRIPRCSPEQIAQVLEVI